MDQIELDAQEQSEWTKTRTSLTWTTPAFSHIFYSLLDNAKSKHIAFFTVDPEVPSAATDGSNIILNPKYFFKCSLQERIFIIAHEILHCVFDHPRSNHKWGQQGFVPYADGTKLPYDHQIMNFAEDYHINALLIKTGVGKYNPSWLYLPSLQAEEMSVLEIYRLLYQNNKRRGGGGSLPGGSEGQSGFDKLLPPNVTLQGNNPPPSQSQWKSTVAAAVHLAKEQAKHMGKQQGDKAMALARALDKINEPVIDWTSRIRGVFARKVGSDRYDWRRPDRRFITRGIYTPARAGNKAGHVVAGCDTSGSMGQKDIAMCFAEVSGILDGVKPERISLLWCDAFVHRVDEIGDTIDLMNAKKKDAPGGGGTDFRPVFRWVEKECNTPPDCLVFLTDGYGRFPSKKPDYPVFWVCISPEGSVNFPFGDVIYMPHADRDT